MQEEDAFLTNDDQIQYWGRSAFTTELDKSLSLTGGIRYLDHRVDPVTGKANLTRAEMYAEAYTCTLITPEYDTSPLDCDWSHSYPIADLSRHPPRSHWLSTSTHGLLCTH